MSPRPVQRDTASGVSSPLETYSADPTGPTWLEIDLGAIRHNLRTTLSSCPPGTKAIAVIKADAYGHGAGQVAGAALEAGAWGLAVARVGEGLELRQLGFTQPILVLGYATEGELPAALANDLILTISGWQTALALSALGVATGRVARVHLKVDTGMRRFGVEVASAPRFLEALAALPFIELHGLYTHFATADEPGSAAFTSQIRLFEELVAGLKSSPGRKPLIVHAANSAAAARDAGCCYDAVRVGIALYGVQPSNDSNLELAPAMSVKARIGRVLDVHAGEGVSYGHEYVARKSHKAAVVACGYADGYLRALSDVADVLIGGRRCRVLGRVCMDSVVVGLPVDLDVTTGDQAVLLGTQGEEQVTAAELAERAGTIPYEILCGMGRRSVRLYVG